MRTAYRILAIKYAGKKKLRTPRRAWEDNITRDV